MQWFIKEQIEEVATMSDLLRVVERSQERPMDIEDYLAREQLGEARRRPDGAAPRRRRRVSTAAALRAAADDVWRGAARAPVRARDRRRDARRGALPVLLRQDYVFLIDYGRLLALGAARAPRLADMRRFAALAQAVLETEMTLHTGFAQSWGIPPPSSRPRPAPATRGYCDFLLRTAATGDFAELCAALLPCMWGYAEIGARLAAAGPPDRRRYATWIATYADPEFQALAAWCRELVDTAAADAGPARWTACMRPSAPRASSSWASGRPPGATAAEPGGSAERGDRGPGAGEPRVVRRALEVDLHQPRRRTARARGEVGARERVAAQRRLPRGRERPRERRDLRRGLGDLERHLGGRAQRRRDRRLPPRVVRAGRRCASSTGVQLLRSASAERERALARSRRRARRPPPARRSAPPSRRAPRRARSPTRRRRRRRARRFAQRAR